MLIFKCFLLGMSAYFIVWGYFKLCAIEEMLKINSTALSKLTDPLLLMRSSFDSLNKNNEDFEKILVKQKKYAIEINKNMSFQEKTLFELLGKFERSQKVQDNVIKSVGNITKDFHALATKLADGSIRNWKIISEEEYIKATIIKKK